MDSYSDYCDDLGEAFLSRPSSIETVGGEWRGSIKSGGIDARVMRDATVQDALLARGVLTVRQHDAACHMHGLFHGGGLSPVVSGGYGQRIGGRSLDGDGATSADEYRAVVRSMPQVLAVRIDGMVLQDWREGDLDRLREALDWVARELGL